MTQRSAESSRSSRSLVRLRCGDYHGIQGRPVEVQVDVCPRGDPRFQIVGLAGKSTRESRERIRAAIRNSGLRFPTARILVNLAPATQKKEGSGFDLPVALGILLASPDSGVSYGGGRARPLSRLGFIGELGLEGELRPVRGALLMADAMLGDGVRGVVVPAANAEEVSMLEGIEVYGVDHLRQVVDGLASDERGEGVWRASRPASRGARPSATVDFSEVRGQEATKRGLLIAAAGGHNTLLCGAPGVGKTMLARRLPTILPRLSTSAAMEVLRVRSVVEGELGAALPREPPFRAPHHTVSYAGLVGGGVPVTPGEVTRAHRGVLFLDEFPEFASRSLEALREPLEEGEITVGRACGALTFPASFLMIAAMNPCPCGYEGHPRRVCRCSSRQVANYLRRLSGPLRDRIDVFLRVAALEPAQLIGRSPAAGELDSRTMLTSVRAARGQQDRRWGEGVTNARCSLRTLLERGAIDDQALAALRRHSERLSLSARAFTRTLRVGRTIADLAKDRIVGENHVLEALAYREALEPV